MSTVAEIDEMMRILKAINDVEEERSLLTIQTELMNEKKEALSIMVQAQEDINEQQKEMLESLNGILDYEKEKNTAMLACKSQFARGSFQPLLQFSKEQVKKSKTLHDLKQIEVEEKIQNLTDNYADQNPLYRELKQKQKQLHKLQDDLNHKTNEIIRFKKFAAQEKLLGDMMLQESIVDLSRSMVRYNKNNPPKPAPDSTSVAHHSIPLNKNHELKSLEECTISDSSKLVDTNVNDVSVFKLPKRHAVKRKPIEAAEKSKGINVKVDTKPIQTFGEKFKVPAAVKITKKPSNAPHQLTSILKYKEVITNKTPTTLATTQPSPESDECTTLQKNNKNDAPEKQSKSKMKNVRFVDFDSSIESDIVSLNGTNKNDSKSASKIDSTIESSNDSECSDANEGNIAIDQPVDEDMEASSNDTTIEENTPKSKATETTSKPANLEVSPTLSLDLNYDRCLMEQYSTPTSTPIAAASTNADVDTDNSDTSAFHLDFGSPSQDFGSTSQDFGTSSAFPTLSYSSFNFMDFDRVNSEFTKEFADLFK